MKKARKKKSNVTQIHEIESSSQAGPSAPILHTIDCHPQITIRDPSGVART